MSVTLISCNGCFWYGPAPSQLNSLQGFELITEEHSWLRLREKSTGNEYFAGLSNDGRFVERLTRCGIARNGDRPGGMDAGTLYADTRDILLTEHAWPDNLTNAPKP